MSFISLAENFFLLPSVTHNNYTVTYSRYARHSS